MHAAAAAAEVVPAAQFVQADDPALVAYLPAGQLVQLVAAAAENLAEGHLTHFEITRYCPAVHVVAGMRGDDLNLQTATWKNTNTDNAVIIRDVWAQQVIGHIWVWSIKSKNAFMLE